jgi:hypothetical protein
MKKSVCAASFIILCSFFFGCVAPQRQIPLSNDNAKKISDKTCEITKSLPPNFYAQTTGKAWLPPMIGIAASYSAGSEIVAKNNVEDPSIYVAQEISNILKSKFNLKALTQSDILSESSDIDLLCKTYNKNEFLLDVRTLGWSFGTGAGSNPALSAQYVVSFVISLKVIEVKNKEVLSEAVYIYPTVKPGESFKTFSYDELMDNNAAGIKNELRKGSEQAVQFFKEKALNI